MRRFLPCIVALLFLVTGWTAGPAGAGPAWKDHDGPPGHNKKKEKDEGHKKIPPGQLKKMLRYRAGGPPPWAPAHGYRRKVTYEVVTVYSPPFGIALGRCDRQLLGTALGGVAGGAVGYTVGKGDGRTPAILAGAVIGAIVGGSIGRSLDQLDGACVGQVLEHAPDFEPAMWRNPRTGARYHVIPQRSFQIGEEYCREYTTTAIVGGREEQIYGTACRQPDGSWRLTS